MPARTEKAIQRIAVIYARYSSHGQKEESIEQQVEECQAFAAQNGLTVVEVYADKAITGKRESRAAYQRMLYDAEQKKFEVIIAYKSSRIARNMLNGLQLENRLDEFGVQLLYAKEEFGNNAAGRFALRSMMNVNQFYSENMAEDIVRGMSDNARACKANGGVRAIGYRTGADGRFVIDEDEAAVAREIFESVASGIPFVEIINSLNGRGIPTVTGGRWNKNSFAKMITNERYIGVYSWGGERIPDAIPAIISESLFMDVQARMTDKGRPRKKRCDGSDYMLTGKLICGECGEYMVGGYGTSKSGTKHYYYSCRLARKGGACKKKPVKKDWLENEVIDMIRNYVLQDEVIAWMADCCVEYQQNSFEQQQIAALRKSVSESGSAIRNLMSAMEQGIITPSTKARLMELEAEKERAELALERMTRIQVLHPRERFVEYFNSFRAGSTDDYLVRKHLIQQFINSITLYDDHAAIAFNNSKRKGAVPFRLNQTDVRTVPELLHQTKQTRLE
ncbi:MAG: recombinase family protein [Clostridiaceae bacterium]